MIPKSESTRRPSRIQANGPPHHTPQPYLGCVDHHPVPLQILRAHSRSQGYFVRLGIVGGTRIQRVLYCGGWSTFDLPHPLTDGACFEQKTTPGLRRAFCFLSAPSARITCG